MGGAFGWGSWARQLGGAAERGRWAGQLGGAGGRGRWAGQLGEAGGRGSWAGQLGGAAGQGSWARQSYGPEQYTQQQGLTGSVLAASGQGMCSLISPAEASVVEDVCQTDAECIADQGAGASCCSNTLAMICVGGSRPARPRSPGTLTPIYPLYSVLFAS